jgi:hypothetical protein
MMNVRWWRVAMLVLAANGVGFAASGMEGVVGAADEAAPVAPGTCDVVRVNCGGMRYTDRLGRLYEPDQAYSPTSSWGHIGGEPSSAKTGTETQGADEPELFLSDRWGFDAYRFHMKPGVYRVTLLASEYHFQEPGARIFNLSVNGTIVAEALDLVARAGLNRPYVASVVVLAEDGVIDVVADGIVDQGKVAAITVEPAEPDTMAPPVPGVATAYPREGEVGLDWVRVEAEDIHGYFVYRASAADGEFVRLNEKPLSHAWFIDEAVALGSSFFYRVSSVDFFGNESDRGEAVEAAPRVLVAADVTYGVNVGGAAATDAKGRRFVGDRPYNPANGAGWTVNGRARSGSGAMVEPFVSVMEGAVAYRFDVPPGLYRVSLGFYDEWSREPKDRVFDVYLGSFRALIDFDLVARYGSALPVEVWRVYRVGTAGLEVSLVPGHGQPQIAMIHVEPATPDRDAPAAPVVKDMVARDTVNYIAWSPVNEPDVVGYTVLRADGDSPAFRMVATSLVGDVKYVDKAVSNGVRYRYQVTAVDASGNESRTASEAELTPTMPDDDQLLDIVSRAAFAYFVNECDPKTFLTLDKNTAKEVSVAAAGFGLSAYVVGAERGWLAKDDAENRVYLMLRALNGKEDNKSLGIFFHYLKGDGSRSEHGYEDAASTVDTALLAWGAIAAAEYFGGRVKEQVDTMLARMNWRAFANESRKMIAMAYRPAAQAFDGLWDYYTDEAILVALLAVGSPTDEYRLGPEYYFGFKRDRKSYKDIKDIVPSWSGSLFTYAFAHCWLDFRTLGPDQPEALGLPASLGVNWWENSVKAIQANRAFCIAMSKKFQTFGENAWGLTASSGPGKRYVVAGAPPCGDMANPAEGTLAIYGAGMSVPFLPAEALAALRNYYTMRDDQGRKLLWRDEFDGGYGFIDSYNVDKKFYSEEVQGINQGPMLLMIENHRSGLLWKQTLKNKMVRDALARVGFTLEP